MHTVRHQSLKYDKKTFDEFLNMLFKCTNVLIALLLIRHGDLHLDIDETYKDTIEENLKLLQLTETLEMIKEFWK